jgi:alkylated DNA nucleotide flippase Atl1
LLVLLIATALGTTALAQSLQTGTIAGKVTDPSGARLPGVTVTATSPVLITPRVATTDEEGGYRIASLPAGKYTLAFELTGFRKLSRSEVVVSIATTHSLDASLEVGSVSETIEVVGGQSLVDVTQTNVATNLDVAMLQGIPTARDVWAILQNMAPQVVLDREDVGGSEGGLQAVFSTHGSSWHQNTYAMGGVNVTDPAATGAAGFY